MTYRILVENAEITGFHCDVLVLKYAQGFHGADRRVANLIYPEDAHLRIRPRPNDYTLLPSNQKLAAPRVLFVGVPSLSEFDYEQIRMFSKRSLEILSRELPQTTHVAMTIHGVGYGLDERESFLAQIAGVLDAFQRWLVPTGLQRITFVERDAERAARLKTLLDENLSTSEEGPLTTQIGSPSTLSAGKDSYKKPHVFVAMPFSKEMGDVYRFGIQGPVNASGLLCERVDMATFTGDILTRVRSRIETASLVIADLTGANPNVFLEVGYAWGKDRSTLLLIKATGEELKFDVRGQRIITYESISDLEDKLLADLASLFGNA
ncbi:MAG TPA: hypothetical protein VEW46_03155 [Pyrinomonadaceae bacterium]|nr:hypothetical protein [Pyrinomonadaceae bacterium]